MNADGGLFDKSCAALGLLQKQHEISVMNNSVQGKLNV